MSDRSSARPYDIVLYGASSFVGKRLKARIAQLCEQYDIEFVEGGEQSTLPFTNRPYRKFLRENRLSCLSTTSTDTTLRSKLESSRKAEALNGDSIALSLH